MELPWLQADLETLRAAHAAGRLPHALLIHESPGAGGEWLAGWLARLALCTLKAQAPCGHCTSCEWASREQHPDLSVVRPIEESKQIRIEQVRDLSGELTLKSHQGGYKVGVISPADTLNRFAANALLKTLEEPAPGTLLVLVVTQPSRLPVTIRSRCQRISLRAPAREQSLTWLRSRHPQGDWDTVLDVLGEAPLDAVALDPGVIGRLRSETLSALEEAARGHLDPAATAERWSRSELPLRLKCFETWLTNRIRGAVAGSTRAPDLRPGAQLPKATSPLNIRNLFELLDGLRELRALEETSINRSLTLEVLLRRLAPVAA